jgi:hypothetical protein
VQCLRSRERLGAARLIIVLEDDDVTAGECLYTVVDPLAARGRCRAVAKPCNTVGVLLALADEHGGVGIFQKLRPPVWHAAHVAERPNKSAAAVWPSLPEAFRLQSDHLIQQRAVGIYVVIGSDVAFRSVLIAGLHRYHECALDGIV